MYGYILSFFYFIFWLAIWIFGLLSIFQMIFAVAKLINRELIRVPHNLAERYGKGSWVVITGATGGIGFEFCKQLAKVGFNIVLMSRRLELLQESASELKKEFSNIKTKIIQVDFAEKTTVEDYKEIEDQLKDLDISILINNAGKCFFKFFKDVKPEEIHDMVNINCTSYAMMTHGLINKLLKRQKRSGIINVASLASFSPLPYQGCYSGTKRLVRFFSYGLHDNYKHKVDILCLSPGFVETKMVQEVDPDTTCSPETTVKNALRDLGHEIEVTGYWMHTLQGFVVEILYRYLYPFWEFIVEGEMKKLALRAFYNENKKDL